MYIILLSDFALLYRASKEDCSMQDSIRADIFYERNPSCPHPLHADTFGQALEINRQLFDYC